MKNEPIDKDNKSQTQIVAFHLPQFHTFPENVVGKRIYRVGKCKKCQTFI